MNTPKRPKKTKPRAHLPALTPLELEAFQQRLTALSGVSDAGKREVMRSMQAAANPNAESPRVVIKTLEKEEQERIKAASLDYARTLGRMNARGKAALQNMTNAEFEAKLRGEE